MVKPFLKYLLPVFLLFLGSCSSDSEPFNSELRGYLAQGMWSFDGTAGELAEYVFIFDIYGEARVFSLSENTATFVGISRYVLNDYGTRLAVETPEGYFVMKVFGFTEGSITYIFADETESGDGFQVRTGRRVEGLNVHYPDTDPDPDPEQMESGDRMPIINNGQS